MSRYLTCACLLLAACGEAPTIEPVFDAAALEESAPFFDFPYPSDLRTDATGRPVLTGLTRARGLVGAAVSLVEEERPGFSIQSAIYFRFTGAIDPASLPADGLACQAEGSSIALIDVDPASSSFGERMPCLASFRVASTRYWPENVLVVRPVPGLSMHPARTYAAVVLDSIRGAGGERVVPSASFLAARAAQGEIGAAYAPIFEALEAHGIARERIVVATALTTSDPAAELDAAREWVLSQPVPDAYDWQVRMLAGSRLFEASFDTYELIGDAPPYASLGDGRFRFDAAGAPQGAHRVPVRVGITVPLGMTPAGGFPIVLYGHGTGGDHNTHTGAEGAAMAARGIAMLGFDAPLHGARTIGVDPETLLISNVVIGREMLRQSAIDLAILFRMLDEGRLDVPDGVDPAGPIHFSSTRPLYMGHSQGAQLGGLSLAIEPGVQAGFLSEGGGGALITVLERDVMGTTIACALATLINEECADVGEDHPLLTSVVQPLVDPADPLDYAHRMIRERPSDWAPLHVAMTEGSIDQYTPPRTIEALAAAIGLPVVEPTQHFGDALVVLGSPAIAAPVRRNLATPGGTMVTGGLMQWAGQDHFVIYALPDAQNRYVEFLAGGAMGLPVIVPPR